MIEYWSARLADALHRSRTAPTEQLRAVHLRTVVHYQALIGLELPRNTGKDNRLAA